jgi:hypothetical protein
LMMDRQRRQSRSFRSRWLYSKGTLWQS